MQRLAALLNTPEPGRVVQLLRNQKWGRLSRNVGLPQAQLSKIISLSTETNPEVDRGKC